MTLKAFFQQSMFKDIEKHLIVAKAITLKNKHETILTLQHNQHLPEGGPPLLT